MRGLFLTFIMCFFAFQAQAFEKCGKRIEEPKRGYFSYYECDEDKDLKTKKIFKKYDFIEEDFYNKGELRPYKRSVLKSELLSQSTDYYFTYQNLKDENDLSLAQVKVKGVEGDAGTFKVSQTKESLSRGQLEYGNKPVKALVIDSGFDLSHKDLLAKHHYNSNETLNGLDDDGDGVVDNISSLHGDSAKRGQVSYRPNINEPMKLKKMGVPLSHGTAVSSVLMQGIDEVSFIGMSGYFQSPAFLYKALDFINKHNVLVVNMSFGFGDRKGPVEEVGAFDALSGIMFAAPNTIFVVASGNSTIDFNDSTYSEYPTCLRMANIITVGALNTDRIEQSQMEHYKRASLSNYGSRCVDLFAPGEKMKAAAIGNSYITPTGTSLSAPYVGNLILKMHEEAPHLSAKELRRAVLDTVYVPKEPMKARYKGFVDPAAAMALIESSL